MLLLPGRGVCGVGRGHCYGMHISLAMDGRHYGLCACSRRSYDDEALTGGIGMKIVVIDSPKFLKGILRLVFKMKKVENFN